MKNSLFTANTWRDAGESYSRNIYWDWLNDDAWLFRPDEDDNVSNCRETSDNLFFYGDFEFDWVSLVTLAHYILKNTVFIIVKNNGVKYIFKWTENSSVVRVRYAYCAINKKIK